MIKSPSSLASGSSCANPLHTSCLFSARLSVTGRAVRRFEAARLRHTLGPAAALPAHKFTSIKAASPVQITVTNSLAASKSASGSRKSAAKQEPETHEQRQRQALQCYLHTITVMLPFLNRPETCMLCRSVKPDKKSNKSKPANFAKKFKTSSRSVIVQQVNLTSPRLPSYA